MKTFKQFQEQVTGPGGSPGQLYRSADPGPPKGERPPKDFNINNYLPKKDTKQAQRLPEPPPLAPDGKPFPVYVQGEQDPGRKYERLLRGIRNDRNNQA